MTTYSSQDIGSRDAVPPPDTSRPELLELKVNVEPAELPVSLADTKEYLRVDADDQDAVIPALIEAATQWASSFMRRSIVLQELTAIFRNLPPQAGKLYLPLPILATLNSVDYEDTDGATQSIDVNDLETYGLYGYVAPKVDECWPRARSATFNYDAGWADAASVPDDVKQAIKIAVSQMFEYRVDQVTESLSDPHTKASMALLERWKIRAT